MKLKVDFAKLDVETADALTAALAAWRAARATSTSQSSAQLAVAHNTGSPETAQPHAGDPAGDKPEVEAAPASTSAAVTEEKPKRTRKPKEEAAPGKPEQASPTGGEPITIDDLRAALQRLTARDGVPAGIEVLKGFGCSRVSELAEKSEEDKAAFVAKCPAAVAEAA